MTSVEPERPVDVLADIRELLERQNELLEQIVEASRQPRAGRHRPQHEAAVLDVLARALGDLDLNFEAREVLSLATADDALDTALRDAGILSTHQLGYFLRACRNRSFAGLTLMRVGSAWRLVRTSSASMSAISPK